MSGNGHAFYVARDPEKLRDLRLDAGLSQEDLLERIRTQAGGRAVGSVPMISRAENGEPIRPYSAARIARALGRDRADLFILEKAAA